MKKRFFDKQAISILCEAEAEAEAEVGVTTREFCRKKFDGMEVPEAKWLKPLNRRRPPQESTH